MPGLPDEAHLTIGGTRKQHSDALAQLLAYLQRLFGVDGQPETARSALRRVRDRELAKLDIEYQRADERDDASAKADVAARKQRLRDIPQTYDVTIARTPAELAALWPEKLPREES